MGRLKTGTPPRLLAETINWKELEKQKADIEPVFFSFLTTKVNLEQIDWKTSLKKYLKKTKALVNEI